MNVEFDDYRLWFGLDRITVLWLLYPINCAKIQIDISQAPVNGFKNILVKIRDTYHRAGLLGCYAGFVPSLCSNMLYVSIMNMTRQIFTKKKALKLDYGVEEDKFVCQLSEGVVCRTVAVVLSHPLYVVATRMVAQMVSQETKYSGLSALLVIAREEGLRGLFAGLLPRLLSDLTVFITTTTAVYLIRRLVVNSNQDVNRALDATAHCVSRTAFYQLTVTSSRMAVTNSGLQLGSPPHMPHYNNMFDCLSHINYTNKSNSLLKR